MNRLSAVETVIMSRIIKKRLGFVYNLCGEIKLNIKNWNLNSQGSLIKSLNHVLYVSTFTQRLASGSSDSERGGQNCGKFSAAFDFKRLKTNFRVCVDSKVALSDTLNLNIASMIQILNSISII